MPQPVRDWPGPAVAVADLVGMLCVELADLPVPVEVITVRADFAGGKITPRLFKRGTTVSGVRAA